MIGIRITASVVQNIILNYNDVEISIALKAVKTIDGKKVDVDITGVKLYHKDAGDITSMYTHYRYGAEEIYVEDGDEFIDELQDIIVFIDKLNEFKYIAKGGCTTEEG